MTFRLAIDTDNAAFGDVPDENVMARHMETARILKDVAKRLEQGEDFEKYRTLFDINGNDVGRAAFKRA